MVETHIPITLEMFQPSGYSDEAELNMARLIGQFYGRQGLSVYRIARRGNIRVSDIGPITDTIDQHFLGAVARIYLLPSSADPEQFYLRQQKHAVQVVETIVDRALPEFGHRIGLRNEVNLYSDKPSNLLRLLARPDDEIDPKLRFEAVRHLLLAHISGEIDARSLGGKLRSEIAQTQELLDNHLYEGPTGGTRLKALYAHHDNQTNTALGLWGDFDSRPDNSHIKRHLFETRFVEGVGEVYTRGRKKSDADAILKSFEKARGNKGVIKPAVDITDGLGVMFVTMDDSGAINKLVDRTLAVLESHPRGVADVNEDNKVDNNRGQAEAIRFRRFYVTLRGVPVPLELIFYTPVDYLNTLFEVGITEPKTGLLGGRAHSLYEMRRIQATAPILFPHSLYRVDTQRAIAERMEKIAGELKSSRVFEENPHRGDNLVTLSRAIIN